MLKFIIFKIFFGFREKISTFAFPNYLNIIESTKEQKILLSSVAFVLMFLIVGELKKREDIFLFFVVMNQ